MSNKYFFLVNIGLIRIQVILLDIENLMLAEDGQLLPKMRD